MLNTVEAIVRNSQIVPLEAVELAEGTRALVTILSEDDAKFWLAASKDAADKIWENEEDDVYAELLAE